jgi:AcrR family transcriptional regulator
VPKDSAATRQLLLDTAERLMAEHGADGVSMREISAGAGQGNNNAAQYHFRTREGIIEAVLDRRMGPIDERRAEMIAALGPAPTLGDLVRTVVVPLAEASRRHTHYIGFFAQLRVSRRHSHLVTYARPRTSSFLDVRDQIDARLSTLPPAVRSQRRWLCGSLIVHAIAEFVAAPAAQPYERWDDLIDGIVSACVHILEGVDHRPSTPGDDRRPIPLDGRVRSSPKPASARSTRGNNASRDVPRRSRPAAT